MSTTLVKLTAEIVSSHATGSPMSSDDLIQEISKVFTALKRLETEGTVAEAGEVPATAPVISLKKAFKNLISSNIHLRGNTTCFVALP
jgi:predicted transcriptional regulator